MYWWHTNIVNKLLFRRKSYQQGAVEKKLHFRNFSCNNPCLFVTKSLPLQCVL